MRKGEEDPELLTTADSYSAALASGVFAAYHEAEPIESATEREDVLEGSADAESPACQHDDTAIGIVRSKTTGLRGRAVRQAGRAACGKHSTIDSIVRGLRLAPGSCCKDRLTCQDTTQRRRVIRLLSYS